MSFTSILMPNMVDFNWFPLLFLCCKITRNKIGATQGPSLDNFLEKLGAILVYNFTLALIKHTACMTLMSNWSGGIIDSLHGAQ